MNNEMKSFIAPYIREQLDGSITTGFDLKKEYHYAPYTVNCNNNAGKEEVGNSLIYQALKFSQHFLNYAWLLRDSKIGLPIVEEAIPENNKAKVVSINGSK